MELEIASIDKHQFGKMVDENCSYGYCTVSFVLFYDIFMADCYIVWQNVNQFQENQVQDRYILP